MGKVPEIEWLMMMTMIQAATVWVRWLELKHSDGHILSLKSHVKVNSIIYCKVGASGKSAICS